MTTASENKSLLKEYIKTYKQTNALLEKCTDPYELKILRGMVSDLKFTIRWLKQGSNPDLYRKGHTVVKGGGYDKRKAEVDLMYFGQRDKIEILGEIDPERVLTQDERVELMYVLRTLTERQLTCFLLHTAHMRSMQQIADELGIIKRTVQEHIETARAKIEAFKQSKQV